MFHNGRKCTTLSAIPYLTGKLDVNACRCVVLNASWEIRAPSHFFDAIFGLFLLTGSSQPMGSVNPLGGPAPGAQRMFSQAQGMMGMGGVGQGGGPAPGAPPAASQAELSMPSCGGASGLDVQQVLYGNMPMHPSQHPGQQRPGVGVSVGGMPGSFRQNVMAQQQHLKSQPNAALIKQQQQQMARLPSNMANPMATSLNPTMPGSMQGGMPTQTPSWQQQQQQQQQAAMQPGMGAQPSSNNGGMPPGFGSQGFHMQPRMPKLPNNSPFGLGGRPMGGMSQGQMMPGMPQQRTNNPALVQQQGQPGQQQPGQAQPPPQAQLPDLSAFGQPQPGGVPNRTAGMPCSQGYQVNRTSGQQLPFGFTAQSGPGSLPSFPGESDLVDSLLKGQATQEWMDDLDELLASHQ